MTVVEEADTQIAGEAIAHALLRMVVEHPACAGRLRAARLVGGYSVPDAGDDRPNLSVYSVDNDWPLREIVGLVDALIHGGLLVQTPGPRPVLVASRSGFRALEALEAVPE